MKKALLALAAMLVFASGAMAAVTVTATVGNEKPTVGAIQLCDGTCSNTKTLDPATAYKVKVTVTDPNGQSDVNANAFRLEFYKTADSNGASASWDNIALANVAHGSGSGCTESGSTYCLTVGTSDWTTKFLKGTADVYVKAYDVDGLSDSNESVEALTVNAAVGRSEDSTSATYSGAPNSTNNAMLTDQANAYVISTHNGNTDLNVTVTATALDDSVHTPIAVGNQKWYLTNNAGSATPYTGAADTVKGGWARGTYPTSAVQNAYNWLDIPALQPAGAYTGSLTYNSTEGFA